MEEINEQQSVSTCSMGTTYTGNLTWNPPNTTFDPILDPEITIEHLESQLELLERMMIHLRAQMSQFKNDNKKYPKRKLNKNFDIK